MLAFLWALEQHNFCPITLQVWIQYQEIQILWPLEMCPESRDVLSTYSSSVHHSGLPKRYFSSPRHREFPLIQYTKSNINVSWKFAEWSSAGHRVLLKFPILPDNMPLLFNFFLMYFLCNCNVRSSMYLVRVCLDFGRLLVLLAIPSYFWTIVCCLFWPHAYIFKMH